MRARWWFIGAAVFVLVAVVVGIVIATQNEDKAIDTAESAPVISAPEVSVPEPTGPDATGADATGPGNSGADVTVSESSVPIVPEIPPGTGPSTEPPTSAPSSAHPVAGETVTLDDGTIARVNSVTPNAPPVNELFPPDAGTTLSRVDLEVCAGVDGYSANPLYWLGFLEDHTTVDPFIFGGDLPTVTMAPGSCIRGTIDLEVPDGHTLSSVVMRGTIFEEIARWDVTTAVPVSASLQSPNPPSVSALAETVSLDDGSTATVKSVVPNAPPLDDLFPPDPGRQVVRVEVEQCAGSSPRQVNPAYWYATAADNRTGAATFGGSTLAAIQLAPGQCAAGFVEIDLPADASVATVFVTDESLQEAARWRAT